MLTQCPLVPQVEPAPPPKPLTSGWAAILKGKAEAAAEQSSDAAGSESAAPAQQGDAKATPKPEEKRAAAKPAPTAAQPPKEVSRDKEEPKDSAASSQTGAAAAAPPASDGAESKPKEVRCSATCTCWQLCRVFCIEAVVQEGRSASVPSKQGRCCTSAEVPLGAFPTLPQVVPASPPKVPAWKVVSRLLDRHCHAERR